MAEAVGRFLSGRMVNDRPESVTRWRVITPSPVVARSVVGLLGGVLHDWAVSAEGCWEVATEAATVPVLMEGADIDSLSFRLATAPELGVFCFRSDGWELAEILGDVAGLRGWAGGTAQAVLSLVTVIFTTRMGRSVLYTKPVLEVPSGRDSAPGDT